ncbi:TetR/AcrR family transcriptional regulator [[Mycobacterium] vasticus]|uniref:TetR/AcrR family transcriptional regulator n=1 Tax=[Mycobacterium] vasticus TaxID=2875777 RepID=A0ABU5YVW1_9MYCO|nr:TetR/AcrR family transcriptional regulator [Mycolicibacter sp. MYC017]MEB3069222.1 TetR/AcrR family transcriptional regulator [Mycolicibacter sp. MYC017]
MLTSPGDLDTGTTPAHIPQVDDPTVSQQDRRRRIFDAAIGAASDGGYTGVQMREIAATAGLSIRSLRRHYPSTTHLLVTALTDELAWFDQHWQSRLDRTSGGFTRLRMAVAGLISAMERAGHITEALTRAYALSFFRASEQAQTVRRQTSDMFVGFMRGGEADTMAHRHVADILADVWTANVLALVQRRAGFDDLRRQMFSTIDLLDSRSTGQLPASAATSSAGCVVEVAPTSYAR